MKGADLEIDEAMLDNADRHDIFLAFVRQHLFDADMSAEDFIYEMNLRLHAAERAADRVLALLESRKPPHEAQPH
jgi:hypothetical protein